MAPAGMTALLDRFIPAPDVRERFATTVHAPASLVMEVALGFDMQSLPLVRAIFRARELLTGTARHAPRQPRGLLEETTGLGWGVLAQRDGAHVVCGARCRPWLADVVFEPIATERFRAHDEPGYVKIAWTLEATETAPGVTTLAHETRAVATDAASRVRFRRYWRWARFGIVTIRLLLLPAVRREAERRARRAG